MSSLHHDARETRGQGVGTATRYSRIPQFGGLVANPFLNFDRSFSRSLAAQVVRAFGVLYTKKSSSQLPTTCEPSWAEHGHSQPG